MGYLMTKIFNVGSSVAFRELRDMERRARRIFFNSPLYVPGLFQEPAYAEEMICGISGLSAADPEAVERVKVRNDRHTAFLERLQGDDAPQVHAVLDESVLRRAPIGSRTMRNQIEHLIEISRKPTVNICVIPLDYGPHQGLAGSFEVHEAADSSLAFFEGGDGDHIVDDDLDRIALYRDLAISLTDIAASGEEARTIISKIISG